MDGNGMFVNLQIENIPNGYFGHRVLCLANVFLLHIGVGLKRLEQAWFPITFDKSRQVCF